MKFIERQRNWRWLLVEELVDSSRRLPLAYRQDPYLPQAVLFWNAFQKCINSKSPVLDSMKLEALYPEISLAYSIYSSPDVERYFIEALIMAGEETRDIAIDAGYHRKVIEAYEKLFFDVRDKLGQKLYVMGNILGPMFMHGTSSGDYDHLWKSVGYFCGADVLRALWKIGKLTEADSKALSDILRTRLLSQAAVAAFSRKPNTYNAGEIIENYVSNESHELTKAKSEDSSTQDDANNYLAQIKGAVLDYMQLTLRPHLSKSGSIEKCLSGEGSSVNESEFTRPFELVKQP